MPSLNLDETEEHVFRHVATGYGVEVYGGTPEERKAILEEVFSDPTVVVDARDIASGEALVETALRQMGVEEEEIANIVNIGSIELYRTLSETDHNIIIWEFDTLEEGVQRGVAQMMKGVAEQLSSQEIMIGYTAEEGGAVVHAEFDLSGRVRSYGLQ